MSRVTRGTTEVVGAEAVSTYSTSRERRRRGATLKQVDQSRGLVKFSISGRSVKFNTLTVQNSTVTTTEDEAIKWFSNRYPDYRIELVVNHSLAYPWLRRA